MTYRSKRAQRWGQTEHLNPEQRRRAAERRTMEREADTWVAPASAYFQPWMLTRYLDLADLWDPELSEMLQVPVGEVDAWEEGLAVPTAEQVRALARLVKVHPSIFYPTGDRAVPPCAGETFFVSHIGKVTDPHVPVDCHRWKHARPRPDLREWRKRAKAIAEGQLSML